MRRLASEPEGERTAVDWVARARGVAPLIAADADRIEQERALTDDVLSALYKAGLFRLLLPRSCGGAELEPAVYLEAVEEIAKADASTAWCLGQACGGSIAAAYLAPEVAHALFGDARAVVASGPNFGKAIAVDDGYRVSGTWPFASGSKHATWIACHCLVQEADGTPRLNDDGQPLERTMFLPKSSTTFTDIWHVMGLKGTGSDQYTVSDVFVPAAYSFTRERAAERRETGPLYRIPIYQTLGVSFAGVALGIARASLDAFVALARDKAPRNSPQILRDNAAIQMLVGMSETRLQAARAFLMQILHEMWKVATHGGTFSPDQRASLRMAITNASHQSREVVDAVYHAAGATAVFADRPFERRFRDMNTVSQQVQAHASNFELIGQHLLGLAPKSKYL